MTGRDPFAVDTEKALDALQLTLGEDYPDIRYPEGTGWGAYRRGAVDLDVAGPERAYFPRIRQ